MNIHFPNYDLIKKYFYLNFGLAYNLNETIENNFVKNDSNYIPSFNNIFDIEPIFFEWKNYKFPIFIHQNETLLINGNGQITIDIYLNVFLFLSGWQEIVCPTKDEHDRFPYKESLQFKHGFTEIPLVNIYFELLYETALKNNAPILRKKYSSDIIFTHDIDQLRSGWFENIQLHKQETSLTSFWNIFINILSKAIGFKDDYLKGMERMLAIDKENNIEAISFFIPVKSHKDADFNLKESRFLKVLKTTKKTQTIGIHPGYETFNNSKEYANQLETLEELTEKKITKSRQHFLRYDINQTPFIQDNLAIKEDYTLGFAEQFGFRNGITNPFYLFNFTDNKAFTVKQIPLVFMDVSLTNYDLEKDFDSILLFLQKTKKDFNCHFSILFHNSVFSNGKYKGFEALYKRIIAL
mgnify:CR=1 FL=1|tara:strand:+ start:4865 stop:6094 length:1230 start_codon:yes stop_codon:yes gene_type:complete